MDDKKAVDYPSGEDPMDDKPIDLHSLEDSEKDFSGLTDIYWVLDITNNTCYYILT